jgi:hypothetical protein
MTDPLDHLTELEAKMTPGPWAKHPRCDGIIGGDNNPLLYADSDGYAECWHEEDAAAIAALRNAAPALLECARTLHAIRRESHWTTVHQMIDAALARLENTK